MVQLAMQSISTAASGSTNRAIEYRLRFPLIGRTRCAVEWKRPFVHLSMRSPVLISTASGTPGRGKRLTDKGRIHPVPFDVHEAAFGERALNGFFNARRSMAVTLKLIDVNDRWTRR
jgi:hypothetical protein